MFNHFTLSSTNLKVIDSYLLYFQSYSILLNSIRHYMRGAPLQRNPELSSGGWTPCSTIFHGRWVIQELICISVLICINSWCCCERLCSASMNFFNCYSITVVCIFSPSLYPTQVEHPSLPDLHPPPWFCPCVLYSSSCNPLFPLCPPAPRPWLLLDCS